MGPDALAAGAEAAPTDIVVRPLPPDHRPAHRRDAGSRDLALLRRPLADRDQSPVRRPGRRHRLGGGKLQDRPYPRLPGAHRQPRRTVAGPLDRASGEPAAAGTETIFLVRADRPLAGAGPVGPARRSLL